MKQPVLLFLILTISSICLSCAQTGKESTQTESNTSNTFIASMRNMKTMNSYLEASNKDVLKSMALITETKIQYMPLTNAASEIQKSSTEFNTHINHLKDLIGEESNGLYALDDVRTSDDLITIPEEGNNKTGVEKVLITEKKGLELFEKLNQLSSDQLKFVDNLWQDRGIYKTIFADDYRKEEQLAKFSDQLLFITSNASKSPEKWVDKMFKDKTIEEVFITLTNLQNQVNLSTNHLIRSLSEQIGRLGLSYDLFDIIVEPKKVSVVLGAPYEAEIALGAYSSQARIQFSVDDQELPMEYGKAKYTIKTTSLGQKKYKAKISIRNPLTGEVETFTKVFFYEVVPPK